MKTLPQTWPFPPVLLRADQRAATITGEATGLIDNVTMPRNPSAGRRPPTPRTAKLDKLDVSSMDAPY